MSVMPTLPKLTAPAFQARKGKQKLSLLTAYDHCSAQILELAGIDAILVGDSLGNVIQGRNSTIPVTLEQMIYHARMVRRGAPQTLTILDMPFGTITSNTKLSLKNCIHGFQQAEVHAVKIEGLRPDLVRACVDVGIPVMAHLGLTPQFIQQLGGFRKHGKTPEDRKQILEASEEMARAGAFGIVLEMVEESLAKEITEKISIPTIGIGSGRVTDGQILVQHDLWGMLEQSPKFAEPTINGRTLFIEATKKYLQRVQQS